MWWVKEVGGVVGMFQPYPLNFVSAFFQKVAYSGKVLGGAGTAAAASAMMYGGGLLFSLPINCCELFPGE